MFLTFFSKIKKPQFKSLDRHVIRVFQKKKPQKKVFKINDEKIKREIF
jgi:hypothetical protein